MGEFGGVIVGTIVLCMALIVGRDVINEWMIAYEATVRGVERRPSDREIAELSGRYYAAQRAWMAAYPPSDREMDAAIEAARAEWIKALLLRPDLLEVRGDGE